MFASCANNSDSNDRNPENPSPSLPENVGENPVKKTIKLMPEDDEYRYLVLNTDGTAFYHYDDNHEKYIEDEFQYTYDEKTKRIYMRVEKCDYWGIIDEEYQLLTYEQIFSKLNEDFTIEKIKKYEQAYYKENQDEEWFKWDYPNCDTYEKYETALFKECGVDSFNDYVKTFKQSEENYYKAEFGAQIICLYEIKDGKMTLTEEFNGVKNMGFSGCYGHDESSNIWLDIFNGHATIKEPDDEYNGPVDTDKKMISFVSEKYGTKINTTYIENIDEETVTIIFNGKEYVCEFEGINFIQTDD